LNNLRCKVLCCATERACGIPINKMPSGLRFRLMLLAACKPSRTSTIFSGVEAGGFRTPIYPNALAVSQGRHQDGSPGKGHVSMEAPEDVHLRDTHQNKLSSSWKLLHSLITNEFVPFTAMRRNMACSESLRCCSSRASTRRLEITLIEYRCEFHVKVMLCKA
jgi:hypothetical protein